MNPVNDTPQKRLFQYLKGIIPKDKSLADCLTEWLHVSSDSAYRRIRGETPLTVDELAVIAEATGMSANELLGMTSQHAVLFEPTRAGISSPDLHSYLKHIQHHLQILDAFDEKEIIYCSKDLPIFHFFLYPELMAFKYHFWMQIILQREDFENKIFSLEQPDPADLQLMKNIAALYAGLPSTEIWNTESVNSTLFQIEYYRTAGYIENSAVIKSLYEQLQELVAFVSKQAELATKYLPGQNPEMKPKNFQLFYNQVCLADNTMLATTSSGTVSVINYGILNYLTCYDQGFCATVAKDIENIMKRSTKLSEGNVRHRTMFFNAINEKINRYKKLI